MKGPDPLSILLWIVVMTFFINILYTSAVQ